jgi:hypothetical protein
MRIMQNNKCTVWAKCRSLFNIKAGGTYNYYHDVKDYSMWDVSKDVAHRPSRDDRT